jgi:hypothetical protein
MAAIFPYVPIGKLLSVGTHARFEPVPFFHDAHDISKTQTLTLVQVDDHVAIVIPILDHRGDKQSSLRSKLFALRGGF